MNDNFDIHPIQWNPIHIRRYWDFFSRRSDYQKNNFAALVGDSLLRIARRHQLPLTGSLLDFGCGCGFFIQKLLKYGGKVTGVEVSEVAADMATASLGEIPGFQGVIIPAHYPLPLPGDHFDGIFLLETIEHFPEEELHTILKELHRLLKKGGYLFITTPNEENLRAGEVICPECGCMFHSGQHLWSWNQVTLATLLERFGFHTRFCQAVTLRPNSRWNFLSNFIATLRGHKKMNLLYIGYK